VASLKQKAMLPGVVVHHASEPCQMEVRQDVARDLNHGLYSLFFLSKALVKAKQNEPPAILSVFSSRPDAPAPLASAMGGFLRTLALEDPRYRVKSIEIQESGDLLASAKAGLLWDEICDQNWAAPEIRYEELKRSVSELVPITAVQKSHGPLPLKEGGVYLLTGGLGGLGLIFAEYLAKNLRAKLVLVGRSAASAAKELTLSRLRSYGAQVLSLQADISRLEDMERVVRESKARFSRIDGVIHAAGVNRDAYVLRKTKEEMEAVLAPKIYGAINVDLATREENLDLFVLFSSVAGVMGNIGQSDYAYANHFLDSFAEQRERSRKAQKRSGRTLSIDWPHWQEGGMAMPPEASALLRQRTGLAPLPTGDGIQYWEDFLQADVAQGVALYGTASRIAATVALPAAKGHRGTPPPAEVMDSAALLGKAEAYVRALIGEEIQLDPARIVSSDRLESFGIDSVMINRMNARLERDLGAQPKTLFYENETIRDVARFLAQQAREALVAMPGTGASSGEVVTAAEGGHEEATATVTPHTPQVMSQPADNVEAVEAIAIVGMHARYPHSATLSEYWDNLKQGRELVDLVPRERWDYAELYDPDPEAAAEGKIYCKWGGFIEDHDKFDARFFQIPAEEAQTMDPQERLFLESVWAALEDAGTTRERLKKRYPKAGSADVGVFVGVTTNSYHLLASEEQTRGNFVTPGALPWSIANRVSYVFDFSGPSLPIDTACSSSLVAIHLACESLRNQECRVAIAGGVNLYLHPSKYQGLCRKGALAHEGKCRSYGAGDEGFVPGEGVGALVLKPLRQAIEDGDRIYATIQASAFDHSGRSNGYSAPNPNAQAALISRMLDKARIEPESIGYVEGHGTGTQLGDAIEIAALTQAFKKRTSRKQYCPVGSVKGNIGHSESAAGIASVAKVILQMQHRQLVPSINSDAPNPNIDFAESPFYLQHGLSEWTSPDGRPRRALVNSFGAGGVSACMVIEECQAPNPSAEPQTTPPYVFVLSARTEERLRVSADRLLVHLKREAAIDLPGLCYTLQAGREAMEERLALVVSDMNELVARLDDWRRGGAADDVYRGTVRQRGGANRRGRQVTAAGASTPADLASQWVAGQEVDWECSYARLPRRVTLPAYPFARERHWVTDSRDAERAAPSRDCLHPLISYNSSTLNEVSFTSWLSDTAFYAADHKVHGESIFPGAGFLEMMCIAANIAGEREVRRITDVVWIQPLRVRSRQPVRTVLRRGADAVDFEISSLDDENETIVHSEGRVTFSSAALPADAGERIAIEAVKARCARLEDRTAYYDELRAIGLQYGPAFQTIQELHSDGSIAVSRLKIAENLRAGFDEFMLHPALIDGALQTVGGLMKGGQPQTAYLPFALDEIEIIRPVPHTCYAYAERSDETAPQNGGVTKFNVRILNESGDVLVRIRNLYVRPLAMPASSRDGQPRPAAPTRS
jgi:acyl transferase domain-containing protein/NADP-dependent 3-hydroxy acid dehydrogenase YdfG